MSPTPASLIDLAQGKALLRPSDAVAQGRSRLYLAQLAHRGLAHKLSRGCMHCPSAKPPSSLA